MVSSRCAMHASSGDAQEHSSIDHSELEQRKSAIALHNAKRNNKKKLVKSGGNNREPRATPLHRRGPHRHKIHKAKCSRIHARNPLICKSHLQRKGWRRTRFQSLRPSSLATSPHSTNCQSRPPSAHQCWTKHRQKKQMPRTMATCWPSLDAWNGRKSRFAGQDLIATTQQFLTLISKYWYNPSSWRHILREVQSADHMLSSTFRHLHSIIKSSSLGSVPPTRTKVYKNVCKTTGASTHRSFASWRAPQSLA